MTHCHCSTATFYLTSRTQAICSLARAYLDTRSQTDVSFKSAQGYVGEECLNIRPHTRACETKSALPFSLSSPFGTVEEIIRRVYWS